MRTRTKWMIIVTEILIIYSTLYIVRSVTTFLKDRGLLSLTIYLLAGICFAGFLYYLLKRKTRLLNILILFPVVALYGFLFVKMKITAEKIHLIEYGFLGFMFSSAINDKMGKFKTGLIAFLITALVGYVDEVIQYFLPNRVYDLRDVGFNALSGLFGLAAFIILKWVNIKNQNKII